MRAALPRARGRLLAEQPQCTSARQLSIVVATEANFRFVPRFRLDRIAARKQNTKFERARSLVCNPIVGLDLPPAINLPAASAFVAQFV